MNEAVVCFRPDSSVHLQYVVIILYYSSFSVAYCFTAVFYMHITVFDSLYSQLILRQLVGHSLSQRVSVVLELNVSWLYSCILLLVHLNCICAWCCLHICILSEANAEDVKTIDGKHIEFFPLWLWWGTARLGGNIFLVYFCFWPFVVLMLLFLCPSPFLPKRPVVCFWHSQKRNSCDQWIYA